MCQKIIYLCFCCEINVIDVNFWKCFYSITNYTYFLQKLDQNHIVNIEKKLTLFEMCFLCQQICHEKCQINAKFFVSKQFQKYKLVRFLLLKSVKVYKLLSKHQK